MSFLPGRTGLTAQDCKSEGRATYTNGLIELKACWLAALFALIAPACGAPPDPRHTNFRVERPGIAAQYDQKTGRLSRIEMDQNKDGRMETVSFWDGTRIERIEVDRDEDGRVDRWEHYGPGNKMTKVGTSRRDDAVEDTWAYPDERGFLFKVESDTDRDGVIDKRETFAPRPGAPDSRVLTVVELGLDKAGRASRRLYYKADGSFDRSVVERPE